MKTIKLLIILIFSILLFSCEKETIIYENNNENNTLLGYNLIGQYPNEVFEILNNSSYDLINRFYYSNVYTTKSENYLNIDSLVVDINYIYSIERCENATYTIPDNMKELVINEMNTILEYIEDSTWYENISDLQTNIWIYSNNKIIIKQKF